MGEQWLKDSQNLVSRMLKILGFDRMAKDARKETRVEVLRQYAEVVMTRAKGEDLKKATRWFKFLKLA